jgi:hypothetical protein
MATAERLAKYSSNIENLTGDKILEETADGLVIDSKLITRQEYETNIFPTLKYAIVYD